MALANPFNDYYAKDKKESRREAFGQQPILGDMRSKTKWSVFIKPEKAKDIPATQDKSTHKVIEDWRKVIKGN
ncbi:hypothetical protein ACQRBE_00380 [Lactobacillus johnsonii]|uniref:hypothetical protein n=1 Tax=Lactobacillus johnsonii TaxID=33959 RepID=UPI003D086DB8